MIPNRVKKNDPIVALITQIVSLFYECGKDVEACPSCSFLPKSIVSTSEALTPLNRIPKRNVLDEGCTDRFSENIKSKGFNLHQYFHHYPTGTKDEACISQRYQHTDCNPYHGAMIIPIFNLAIQAEAGRELFCDHHAFARSEDQSPPVLHGVLSPHSAAAAFSLMMASAQSPFPITGFREKLWLRDVPSPEDPNIFQHFYIEVINMSSHCSTESLFHMKGENNCPPSDVLKYELLRNSDLSDQVDATLILGHFLHEGKQVPPKLLLLRFRHMLCNTLFSVDDIEKMSQTTFHLLHTLAGKYGFELRRCSGTAGKVNSQSDRDLTDLMACTAMTPRVPHACLILKDTFKYHILYMGQDRRTVKHIFYSPPKPGGSFQLPDHMLDDVPILAEFTYLKMLAVLIVKKINLVREKAMNLQPIASRVVECEYQKIVKSRMRYNQLKTDQITVEGSMDSQDAMIGFISCFNQQHRFSMVCYPVGFHYDYFKDGDESLENRILLSFPRNSEVGRSYGRGGGLSGDDFVFALLDW